MISFKKITLWFLLCTLFVGCKTTDSKKDDPNYIEAAATLEERTELFYRYMRWEMFDEASQLVDAEFRDEFLREYADHKESFDITTITPYDIEVINPREVEVSSRVEWYRKPQHIIQNKKFRERWRWNGESWYLENRGPEDTFLSSANKEKPRPRRHSQRGEENLTENDSKVTASSQGLGGSQDGLNEDSGEGSEGLSE